MPVHVADFASLQVFAEWRQNVPKWVGKLWSLIVKTLNFDWPAVAIDRKIFFKRFLHPALRL